MAYLKTRKVNLCEPSTSVSWGSVKKTSRDKCHKKYDKDDEYCSCDSMEKKECKSKKCNRCMRCYDCLKTKCGTISICLTKKTDKEFFVSEGEVITYFYEIKNTGTVLIKGSLYISDDVLGGFPVNHFYLSPCSSFTVEKQYEITKEDIKNKSVTNNAKVFYQVTSRKYVCSNNSSVTLEYGKTDLGGEIKNIIHGNNLQPQGFVTVNIYNFGQTQANNVKVFLTYPSGLTQNNVIIDDPSITADEKGILMSFGIIPTGYTFIKSFIYNALNGNTYTWSGKITADTHNSSCIKQLISNSLTFITI